MRAKREAVKAERQRADRMKNMRKTPEKWLHEAQGERTATRQPPKSSMIYAYEFWSKAHGLSCPLAVQNSLLWRLPSLGSCRQKSG